MTEHASDRADLVLVSPDAAPDSAPAPTAVPAAELLVWPPSAEDLDAVEVIRLDGEPFSPIGKASATDGRLKAGEPGAHAPGTPLHASSEDVLPAVSVAGALLTDSTADRLSVVGPESHLAEIHATGTDQSAPGDGPRATSPTSLYSIRRSLTATDDPHPTSRTQLDEPAERERRRISLIDLDALFDGMPHVFDQRATDNDWAGVRVLDADSGAREEEGLVWPPPEDDEASISVLDLETQAAATPLGPPATPRTVRGTTELELVKGPRLEGPERPAAATGTLLDAEPGTTRRADVPANARLESEAEDGAVNLADGVASRRASSHARLERQRDPSTGLFELDTPPPRSPLVSVLIAAAVVAAIGLGSYAFVRYAAEPTTPVHDPSSRAVGESAAGASRHARDDAETEVPGGAGRRGTSSASAGAQAGGGQELQHARAALERGELDDALTAVFALRSTGTSSTESQQLLARILTAAQERVVLARREAAVAGTAGRPLESSAATAAESDALKAWREGRFEYALRRFNDAAAAYGRAASPTSPATGTDGGASGT